MSAAPISERIGITTTIPVEVLFAAGVIPVDLNNIFINAKDAAELVQEAEHDGYPRNVCGWIKGIYSTVLSRNIKTVVAAVEGDCSQTQAMVETLAMRGVDIIPFAFPFGADRDLLRLSIDKLIQRFGVTWDDVEDYRKKLDKVRRKVHKIDDLTWRENQVTGLYNHYYQVCCSDFNSDIDTFERDVDEFIAQAEKSSPLNGGLRLGYIGVPPIITDLYQFLEGLGVRVVYNEIQRQFTMPFESSDIVDQYARYTYPYDVFRRIEDVAREVERRNIQGLIHYTQSFCFRQIQDLIIRKKLKIPILTIEGEVPATLDARTKVRIESFVEMLG
ncbi:MAG: 2-hydroxyacyl-CoA dehydratase [Armatimonadota bacterium]|nr:2-hydroxyacyl-CoA dehydratase [Armatimonadota bacterium]